MPRPCSRSVRAAWFSTRPVGEGNTSPCPSQSSAAPSSTASARGESGTRCARPAFMRSAGAVHTAPSRSISVHRALRTSPDLAAVSTRNSNTSLVPRYAPEPFTRSSAAPTSAWGSARMCCLRTAAFGSAAAIASPSGSANVFRAVLADGSHVKGMVLPGELFWDDDPPPPANAGLVGKGR